MLQTTFQQKKKMKSPVIFFSSLFLFITIFSSADKKETLEEIYSRDFFPMEGDLAWVIQVSDLHLSAYHPNRAEDLVDLLGTAIRIINPDLIFITGDITDAKNRKRTSTRQDESEWIQYRNAMDSLVTQNGFEKRRIFDVRGNHDKYGVPYVGSALDFFSKHSVSSQFNRLGTIQSISLVGDDRSYLFLGIDDTMRIGIRGPSNLFGHPTGDRIRAVETELQYWDNNPHASVTKIVFGHFPLSFTASAEKGERYEPVFARHSVSAYICGHLHAKFGKKLWRLHTSEIVPHIKDSKTVNQFWEWELGDWKEFRFIRILAIHRGDVSFMDIELPYHLTGFKTSILITYPMDSRRMSKATEDAQLVRNGIDALIFSVHPILNVTATIFDSWKDFKIVEDIPLQPATSSSHKPLYHAKWNADNYMSSSGSRYWLQVCVIDSQSKQTKSELRPFSVEGKTVKVSPSLLAFFVFELQWERVFHLLQWSNISFLILLLFLPKLLILFMKRNSLYQRKVIFRLLWFLMEGSRIKTLWYSMVIYLIYLLTLPWFWGHATSEKGNIFKFCLSGWRIQTSSGETTNEWLGIPDLMTITLPFMYFIITPLFLLIYSLSAERSAAYFRSSKNTKCSDMQKNSDAENNRTFLQSGWLRKALLFVSAVIAFLYFKIVSGIMEAYGAAPVAMSPAVSLVPLLFLAAAIYSTMKMA